MSVNDVYKATVRFSGLLSDGEMNFNLHYRTTVVNTPQSGSLEAQDIADALLANVQLNYMQYVPSLISVTGVTVIGITDPTVGVQADSNTPGTGGPEPVSLRSAPVVKLRTGLRGRSFAGRIYLMAPDESQQAGGTMLPTYISDLDTVVDGFRTVTGLVSTNEYSMTIYSKTLSEGGPIIDNLVTSVATNPNLGTQRSRQKVTS